MTRKSPPAWQAEGTEIAGQAHSSESLTPAADQTSDPTPTPAARSDRADEGPAAHPAAGVWPMLSEPDLRRLADDITANGLLYPIVLDAEGRVLDGRNRLAACGIAGVEPVFETYTGDAVARVLSANNERRHLSLPERAAATALTLATDGHRSNGRWTRGTVPVITESGNNTWLNLVSRAGLVLDHAPDLLPQVAAGEIALDAAVKQASEIRDTKKRRAELPDDLGALVDAGQVTLVDALRRAALPDRYAGLVGEGGLDLAEAEHLATREARENAEGVSRSVNRLRNFLDGFSTAKHLAVAPDRDLILTQLDDFDRDRILTIEKEITWPSGGVA